MKPACRFALATLLCLPAALVHAESFELTDPASEMYQEWQDEEKEFKAESAGGDAVCAVDLDTGECSCIDAETEQLLPLSRDDCLDLVSEAAAAELD